MAGGAAGDGGAADAHAVLAGVAPSDIPDPVTFDSATAALILLEMQRYVRMFAQRLVRVICPHCKRQGKVARAMLGESGLDPALESAHPFYEGKGCIECGGTGYKGRQAICELLDLSDRIREMILARRPSSEIKKAARDEGMRFLRESAVEKVLAGVTTLREINKVTFVE